MPEIAPTSYDEIPYSDNVFSYTRPESIGAVATLFGIPVASAERCRVLELGCGTGSNLIPMAHDLPGSQFVGIDLSARQVESGREIARTLGLANIDLRHVSILDVDESFGLFDCIICHGVYSWVPADVRAKILSVCKNNLAEHGIAYVSYNTYPGWHMRGMIRGMMSYHARQFDDPHERVAQARALLRFLAQTVGERDKSYYHLLQIEEEMLAQTPDTYLFHEHLESVNAPAYFHEFAERAADNGLQYLAEAQPSILWQNLSAEAQETIQRLSGTLIQAEQYLDFVRNRTFRRTLLCHDREPLHRPPAPENVMRLCLTGLVRSVREPIDPGAAEAEEFRTAEGHALTTSNPLLRAALHVLEAAWPRGLAFADLWQRVEARLARPTAGPEELAESLYQCYLSRLVELSLRAPALRREPNDRPCASALARFQAASGRPVSNLRHRAVAVEDFDRLLLQYLDGTRDRAALLRVLAGFVADGVLEPQEGGRPADDPDRTREALEQALEASLQRFARNAFFADTASGIP